MKNLLSFVAVLLLLGTGCQSSNHCVSTGWRFEVLKPPTLSVQTPILVQGGQSLLGAHPVGAVAGPVTEGTYTHGPVSPPPPMPLAMPKAVSVGMMQCQPQCQPPIAGRLAPASQSPRQPAAEASAQE